MKTETASQPDYSGWASAYAQHRTVHPEVVRQLAAHLTSESRVLEVGCGTGNYIKAVCAAAGCHGFGVDPNLAMLSHLKPGGSHVQVSRGRAEQLGFGDGSFDFVFSVDVIHHVTDRPACFRESFRVLRPGGRICTVTDSEWVIRNREPLPRYFPDCIDIELKRYPSMSDLHRFMAAAGFVAVREELVEYSFFFSDAGPVREKAFSFLRHLDEAAFQQGLARLEADLARGPLKCVWRYVLLWGER